MTVNFLINNVAPDLTGQDNNFDTQIFIAKKSAGLTMDSASGWRRPGAVEPNSYKPKEKTGVNASELGVFASEVAHHINKQGLDIPMTFKEITPWGNEVKNKTELTPVVTYAGTGATIDVAGGGVKIITTSSIGTIAVGDCLEIPISSGNALYYDRNKRVESISGNAITLDKALDEAPADGVTIRQIGHIDWKRGGTRLRPYSMLGVISGDFKDVIAHYTPHVHVTEGDLDTPKGDTGKIMINSSVVPQNETIDGRIQPITMYERWYP